MKHTYIFILVNLITFCGYCQRAVLSNPTKNILYSGISNRLDIAVNGYDCRDFIVSSNNGQIMPMEDECSYLITPIKTGSVTISIVAKATKKKLDSYSFRIEPPPEPLAFIANQNGGNISKKTLLIQSGIIAKTVDFEYNGIYSIDGYNVSILRGNNIIFSKSCNGAMFSEEIKDAFQKLEINDFILFSELRYKAPNIKDALLQPVEFQIKNLR